MVFLTPGRIKAETIVDFGHRLKPCSVVMCSVDTKHKALSYFC